MSTDAETDFLKYLEPKYKKFKVKPDLSDVVTLDRKLGTALFGSINKYKDDGWSYVVDDNPTHQIRLGQDDNAYSAPKVPT